MLRTLLTERLGVKAHVEQREMAVYALTVAKGGPRFSESASDGPLTARRIRKTGWILKVEGRRDKVPVLVIDHAERAPTEN